MHEGTNAEQKYQMMVRLYNKKSKECASLAKQAEELLDLLKTIANSEEGEKKKKEIDEVIDKGQGLIEDLDALQVSMEEEGEKIVGSSE